MDTFRLDTMTTRSDRDRYNIPVLEFLTQLLAEQFPDLNVGEGSAVYDTLIRPASLMLQPFRDYTRVLGRNLHIRNHSVMNRDELEALAANFLVAPRAGVKARGTQRVYFRRSQPVNVSTTARFSDAQGHTFLPITSFSLTQSQLEAQVSAETGEYYIDVAAVAVADGEEYSVGAGAVSNVQGIQGASRTTNQRAYTAGRNSDSNVEIYNRIRASVTNRDLVKKTAISTAIFEAFDSVRSVEVVGFGDPAMRRDTVAAVVALDSLFSRSFAQKINVPLDGHGNVQWYESDGATVVLTPVGGWVGAIIDTTDIDFLNMQVTLDGRVFQSAAVLPGNRVRLFGEDSSDPDIGDYTVRTVVDGPPSPGATNTRMILLTDTLAVTSEPGDDPDRFPYTILGAVSTSNFHVGGKVDVYVDSAANVEKSVVIGSLVTDANGVAEIPVVGDVSVAGASIFEGSVGFETPVLAVLAVEELDPAADVVVSTLAPGLNYVLVREAERGRFSQATSDVLVIRGQDDDGNPLYNGSRIRIRYPTNADYGAIQAFVDSSAERDVTKDIDIKSPDIAILDVALRYRGTATVAEVDAVLRQYISDRSFGAAVTVNELVSLLNFFGVTDVQMPVTLTSTIDNGDGTIETQSSVDRLAAGRTQVFSPAASLSIRRIG